MTSKDLIAKENTATVKRIAKELGFMYCGISKADQLQEEARRLESWLNRGMHGKMQYMENHFDKRIDPRLLVPGAKSVVSLLFNYHNPEKQKDAEAPKISSYAFGKDYHFVIKDKLFELKSRLEAEIGEIDGRVFVDSAPVMDKAWAVKSGLGWMGKNTNLITREAGSWFFIAELIIDLQLIDDGPIKDYCGNCTRCIDACPTEAIEPYQVDGSKCISYFTIELKESLPISMKGKFDQWMFGCDICQQVCPWNRFAKLHEEPLFNPSDDLLNMTKSDWLEITDDVFKKVFSKSAVQRTGLHGLKRNIDFLKD